MLAYKTAVSKSIINVFLYSLTYLFTYFLIYVFIYLPCKLVNQAKLHYALFQVFAIVLMGFLLFWDFKQCRWGVC